MRKLIVLLTLLATFSATAQSVGTVKEFYTWKQEEQLQFGLGVLTGNALTGLMFNLPINEPAAQCSVTLGDVITELNKKKDIILKSHGDDPAGMMIIVSFYGLCGINPLEYMRQPGIRA